jgi:agmatinase
VSALRAAVAFVGVPFDLGTTLRPGARFGPQAIRAASTWWSYAADDGDAAGGWYDLALGRWILRDVTMADVGDVEIAAADVAANFDRITQAVGAVLGAGSFPVVVGGDHSITFPALRAFGAHDPLHVVQFDAHQDFVDERRGVRFGHGNAIRRASELPFVQGITQIGIRALQKYPEPLRASAAYGIRVVTPAALRADGAAAALDAIPQDAACYLSLDIDALDIAAAPGTGTPEPGGLQYAEVRDAVAVLARRARLVGMDLVEVSPPYDWAEVTSRTAARLILDTLAAIFAHATLSEAAGARGVDSQRRDAV